MDEDNVINMKGEKLQNGKLTIQIKHSIIKRLFSSTEVNSEDKLKLLGQIKNEKYFEGDRILENTVAYCNSADPYQKEAFWNLYFQEDNEQSQIYDWTLDQMVNSFKGFNQIH